ncbi:MAG: TRIC cation channel family protein [Crocinitomicaceae bacterium]|nr:TRIC cation channel family protein [Crocinitomicaceae bacterium]
MFIDWITFLDGIGIFVFAISVVLTAIGKGFDVVGATILLLVLQRRWVEEHCAI